MPFALKHHPDLRDTHRARGPSDTGREKGHQRYEGGWVGLEWDELHPIVPFGFKLPALRASLVPRNFILKARVGLECEECEECEGRCGGLIAGDFELGLGLGLGA